MLYHKNALDLALESRDESSIEALLERGPEINEENPAGWTVLHLAASSGRGLLVRALLEKGADPHEMIPDGTNAIDLALKSKSEESIKHYWSMGHKWICASAAAVRGSGKQWRDMAQTPL